MNYLLNTKIGQMIFAVILLALVVLVLLFLASLADRIKGRGRTVASVAVFLGPGLLLLGLGLVYPALRTIMMSFMDRRSETWVGFSNYSWMFTATDSKQAFINTFIWVLSFQLCPLSLVCSTQS